MNIKRILNKTKRVIIKQQKEGNKNDTTYCTQHTYSYITVNKTTKSSK
jgi:hypothetical protein